MISYRNTQMKKYLVILLIGFGAYTVNSCTTSATSATVETASLQETTVAKNVNANEFAKSIKTNNEVILLDVRTPGELTQGYIDGAINLDYSSSNFQTELNKLDKTKPVYVYCRSGRRSASTMSQMQELGFVEVYNLSGGIIAWSQAGLTIKK